MEEVKKYLSIKKNWCKQCNICIEFCPRKVFKLGEDGYPEIDIEKCNECKLCIYLCPEFAIITTPEIEEELKER